MGIIVEKNLLLQDGPAALAVGEPEAWQRAIDKVIRGVVSVRFTQPHPFDGELAGSSEATGFVVDSERGFVLTNRHVVGSGPFWGRIIFHNQEEADAYPVYRDPVHDFGILRYDPKASEHIDAVALELRPDLAGVGLEIKVIGNDAGEKLSILSGFISRIDRNAPNYRWYRDFNTSYFQANAAATGGSSGSPVVNIDGHAVALQAGGRTDKASTDYFLPLDAPLCALQRLRAGLPIVRGDIQCIFLMKPFEECRRLGLAPKWEAEVRASQPGARNMLVAETVISEGPSDGKIIGGDIVLKVNGVLVVAFQQLEDILNDLADGGKAHFLLHRGGKDVEEEVEVQDMEKISPRRFVSVAGASFHDLSYNMAVQYTVPCKGVMLSYCGTMGEFSKSYGYLIESVNNKPTPNLDQFVEVMKDLPDRARIVMRYRELWELHTTHTVVLSLNRHWPSAMKMVTRNDSTGAWDFEVLTEAPPRVPREPLNAYFSERLLQPAVKDIPRSFVTVHCKMPLYIEGCGSRERSGMGIIVDAAKGIVLVSRPIVPHRMCSIEITIADSIILDGELIFQHPNQGYSLVQYDPSLVIADVRSLTFDPEEVQTGTPVLFVGYTTNTTMAHTPTTITRIRPINVGPLSPAQYRPTNIDCIAVDSPMSNQCNSGVILTPDGSKVLAVWIHCLLGKDWFRFGLGSHALIGVLNQIRDGKVPKLRTPPAEFVPITTVEGSAMGLSREWIAKVSEKDPRHQLLRVHRVFSNKELVEGDILLTINGELTTRATDIDAMYWNETVDVVVLRGGEEMSLTVNTVAEDMETDYVVSVAGLILTRPHLAVRQQIKNLPSEIYVAHLLSGSPAHMYSFSQTGFITHVNDTPTSTVELFLKETAGIADNTYFRVKGKSFNLRPWVKTIKKNDRWFPTKEWRRDDSATEGWRLTTYERGEVIDGEGLYECVR